MPGFCLILEPMPIVAQDLAATAREDLGLEPLIAATVDEARAKLAVLPAAGRVRLAFVHHSPAEFARNALRQDLEARGAQVVLIGPGADGPAAEGGWPALMLPFTTEQVLAIIRGLGGPGQHPCEP